jgi:hypothetical protein
MTSLSCRVYRSCLPYPPSGPHNDIDTPPPPFPSTPHKPTFGTNTHFPFIFSTPPPTSTQPPSSPYAQHAWIPPANFSLTKVFPQPSFQEDPEDVDMAEANPPKAGEKEGEEAGGRVIALGGMKRVFKSRQKPREKSHLRHLTVKRRPRCAESDGESESGEVHRASTPVTQKTSNHYNLHLPAAPVPQPDFPNVLLGCVPSARQLATFTPLTTSRYSYLQFFWNLSLILLFLYLVLQFILTVQRDVEQRISEYSMGTSHMLPL